jgi:adenylate cyclase
MTTTRRLAAILAADVAGYSAAMERDEEGTAAAVRALRREVIEPKLAEHQGRLIKTTGDGFLAEFASPIAALKCALAIQQRPAEGDGLRLRIGLNLGDVIIEESGDVLGEGVNVAARLEGLSEPGGILISSKIYSEVDGKVQATFEDRGEQQVKNITKALRAYAVRTGEPTVSRSSSSLDVNTLSLPDKPSIAVLPFQNMSGDPEQEYFADGMVEDIITALSRFKSLFVIARNSTFTYKGKSVDIKQVGRELGVRYVLEGSVRKASGRVRITGQLIETGTGTHLWAERFDGALEDVFGLQEKVTQQVVGAIVPNVRLAELGRIRDRRTTGADAYDYFLRGLHQLGEHTPAATTAALALFNQAIAFEPDYATATAYAAHCYVKRRQFGWTIDETFETAEAIRLARRAVDVGTNDSEALALAAQVILNLGQDIDQFFALNDRAIDLNPNNAFAWTWSGWAHLYAGRPDVALGRFERAHRLSPTHPVLGMLTGITSCHVILGNIEEGFASAERNYASNRGHPATLRLLAEAAAFAGKPARAREAIRELRQLTPDSTISSVRKDLDGLWRRQADLDRMMDGLRLAGLPE